MMSLNHSIQDAAQAYEASQAAAVPSQPSNAEPSDAMNVDTKPSASDAMEVDTNAPVASGSDNKKRAAESEEKAETSAKKARFGKLGGRSNDVVSLS